MNKTFTLHDDGIADIKARIIKLAERYKKATKKDPNKARLYIVFKRGPITMANGEWSKLPFDKLTMDPNRAVSYFKRSNLNWGILGYGDPKSGLKELTKFAKTKLNPKQLRGENMDLKMNIMESKLVKRDGEVVGKITIVVPDKSLGGTDIQSPILEKQGYLGINKWKQEAFKLLSDNELDTRIKDILENKQKLSDIVKEFSETEDNSSKKEEVREDAEQALVNLGYKKGKVKEVLSKVNLNQTTEKVVKEALTHFSKN